MDGWINEPIDQRRSGHFAESLEHPLNPCLSECQLILDRFQILQCLRREDYELLES